MSDEEREVVRIGSSDVGSVDAAELLGGGACTGGAHFWTPTPPDPDQRCECGEFTHRAFVNR